MKKKNKKKKNTERKLQGVIADIIISTFNNKKIIESCLDSIKSQTYKKFRCIVVDDCSNDGTPELIRKKYKWAKLIKKEKQTGPSISRNLGIKNDNVRYIATLDSDVVLDKNWLKEQIDFIEEKGEKCGIVASKMIFANNSEIINSAGGKIRFPGIGTDIGSGKKDSPQFNKVREVDYACSGAMLMRRSMLDKIGMFDETYFYGHEDTDLGWRARLAGYKVMYNPKAVAYHNVNQTVKGMSEKVIFHGTKNRIRSMIKNCNILILPLNLIVYFFITLGQIFIMHYRFERVKAWWWNLSNLSGTFSERKKVRKLVK